LSSAHPHVTYMYVPRLLSIPFVRYSQDMARTGIYYGLFFMGR